MPELRLVAVSEDGGKLVLRGDEDTEFTVPVDERLHAALRGDRARLGQLQIQLDSQLRPREIQARIRAGESLDAVSQSAGMSPDRVMRFASPVLAERQHMADRARRATVRRQRAEGAPPVLDDCVSARLGDLGVSTESVEWDAFRREDGRWMVLAAWRQNNKPRSARWTFDPAGRSVAPADDAARDLSGDLPPPAPAEPPPPVRLAVVPTPESADLDGYFESADLDGYFRAAVLAESTPPDEVVIPVMERTTATGDGLVVDRTHHDTKPIPQPGAHATRARATRRTTRGPLRPGDSAELPVERRTSEPTDPASSPPPPPRARAAGTQGRRPSVPTWDEIMFGRRRRSE